MTAKQLIGVLALVAIVGGYYIMLQNEVKISITGSQTQFYVWENSKWNSSGIEKNYLYNGSKAIPRGITSVTNSTYGNESNITRNALYSLTTISDAYNFNGSITDKALIPVKEIHYVINGTGLTYIYEITGYDGGFSPQAYSMDFAKKMKVIWKRAPDSIKVQKITGGKVRLRLNYTVQSDYEEYDIRLFDPSTVTIYLNSSSSDRKFELGDVINLTACSSTAGDTVYLNSTYPGKGYQYSSGTTCVTDLWASSSGTTSFTDGANKTISANGNVNVTLNAISETTSGTFLVTGSSNGLTKNVSIDIGNDNITDIILFGNITNDAGFYNHFSDYTISKVLSFQGNEKKNIYYNIMPNINYMVTNISLYGVTSNYTQGNFTDGTMAKNLTYTDAANKTVSSYTGGSSTIGTTTITLKATDTYSYSGIFSKGCDGSVWCDATSCNAPIPINAHNGTALLSGVVRCNIGGASPGATATFSVTDGNASCVVDTSGICFSTGYYGASCYVSFGDTIIGAKTATVTMTVNPGSAQSQKAATKQGGSICSINDCYGGAINYYKEYNTLKTSNVSVWVDLAGANYSYKGTGYFSTTPTQITLNNTQIQTISSNCGIGSCPVGLKIFSATPGQIDAYNQSLKYSDTPSNITVEIAGTQVLNYPGKLNASVSPQYVDLGTWAFQSASNSCTGLGCTITVTVLSDRSGNITVNESKLNYTIQTQSINTTAFSNFMSGKAGNVQVPMKVNATNWGNLNFQSLNLFGKWDANFTWSGVTNASGATNDSQKVMIIWSNFSRTYPAGSKEPIFVGKFNQSYNITPYGQTSAMPGINFTYLAREQPFNISIYLNASLNSCMNLTASATVNKTDGRRINTTNPNNLITNFASGTKGIWLWLDMNASCAQQTRPYIFYKAKCGGCV